jgi:WD40 repeat protein
MAATAADWAPVERQFLEASRARADAELTEAHARADREAAARRRTRRLAGGLAAVLVLALVATLLAVAAQRDAQRTSLIADANRLAALSRTAGSLDDSLLLAAQAVHLAETPDTQDGLLAGLVDRGRAVRAVPFGGRVLGGDLGNDGRTLILGVGGHGEVWSIGPTSVPRPFVDLVDSWWFTDTSPVDDVMVGGGLRADDGRPWLDLVSVDGTVVNLLEGDALGGVPMEGTYSADGRLAHVLVLSPGDDASSSRWRVIDVDPARPSGEDIRFGGTTPVPVDKDTLRAHFADDARSFVFWDADGAEPALLFTLADGRSVPLPAADAVATVGFQALPSGAAQLWTDGTVTLYDPQGAAVQDLDAHQAPVRDVAVAPDGTWAVTVGDDAVVVLWDIDPATGRWSQRELLAGHRGDVITADVDPTGRWLYTAALDDTVITWDMSPGGGFGTTYPGLEDRWISNRPDVVEPGRLVVAPTRPLSSLLPDRSNRSEAPDSVAATFLDPRTGEVVDEVVVGDTIPGSYFGSSVAVSPDGSMVAVTWGLGATVLDAGTHEPSAPVTLPPEGAAWEGRPLVARGVWCAGWTPDSGRLLLCLGATENSMGGVAVVDPRTGEVERVVELPTPPQAMALSPDGRLLAAVSETTPDVYVFDADTVTLERTVPLGADDRPGALAFSPDGERLAAGGDAGLVHVIDTETWRPAFEPIQAHDDPLLQVEWLPDGRTVVSSGADGSVRLSDAERGLALARPLPASTTPGNSHAHFLPEPGDELVALSGDRPGRRYPLDPEVWLDEACAVVGRDFTRAEWDRYLPGRDYEPTCSDRP